jgi:hypothetical protein
MVKPIRRFFLEANPNPERSGCPDETTLKDIAENRLPPNHPARLHLASCSPCFAEFRGFKEEHEAARSSRAKIAVLALAACLLIWIAFSGSRSLFRRDNPPAAARQLQSGDSHTVATNRTIDLFTHGSVRGSTKLNPLEAASLPPSLVHLRLVLPRFSDPGVYTVVVSKDRGGTNPVAEGSGATIAAGDRLLLDVNLDLRPARIGTYFLATVRESDKGTYYYPLNVLGR